MELDVTNAVKYVGRMAPTPSGGLHRGHGRTFLLAWLRAREAGGSLLLRVDDLDGPRVRQAYVDETLRDLEWLGLTWDGAPVYQSKRFEIYAQALQRLTAKGWTYPCTCSRKDIEQAATAPHGVEGLGVRYPGTCRPRDTNRGSTLPAYVPQDGASWRFMMREPVEAFVDGWAGNVDGAEWGGDFVLQRTDGLWAYQLATVVDDLALGVTEVVRGEDLLPSTPRQRAVFAALGAKSPKYMHVPLLRNGDGRKFSKREQATTLAELRSARKDPKALLSGLLQELNNDPSVTDWKPWESDALGLLGL